jgi:hypothetical protein
MKNGINLARAEFLSFLSGEFIAAGTRQSCILKNKMFGPTQQWQEAKLTVWVNSFFIGKYWLK